MSTAQATLFDCLESPLPSEIHVTTAAAARRVMELVGTCATKAEMTRLRAEMKRRARMGNFAAVRVADMLVTMHMAQGTRLRLEAH